MCWMVGWLLEEHGHGRGLADGQVALGDADSRSRVADPLGSGFGNVPPVAVEELGVDPGQGVVGPGDSHARPDSRKGQHRQGGDQDESRAGRHEPRYGGPDRGTGFQPVIM